MPGWIIQGVKGEGKSLCAVGKMRDYLCRGRPVATNLDIFLENLVEPDNKTPVYRLPDYPRSVDFELLPPAYDVRYKGDDRNGLLVLDESVCWLNGRDFKVPDRAEILAWLLQSRKMHWDTILLCQDHEAIDKTARTSLSDYLVQASRSDTQRQTFLTNAVRFFRFAELGNLKPVVHRYDVFSGMSFADKPKETWEFTGIELYNAYDTNQRFHHGRETLNGRLVDMRATFTYLPAAYLSKRVYLEPLENEIERIKQIEFTEPPEPVFDDDEGADMAIRKSAKSDQSNNVKIVLLSVALVVFLGWRVMSFDSSDLPGQHDTKPVSAAQSPSMSLVSDAVAVDRPNIDHRLTFVDRLINGQGVKPRLSIIVYRAGKPFTGVIDFYRGRDIVESFHLDELHALGVAVVRAKYGVELVTSSASYVVTSWPLMFYPSSDGAGSENLSPENWGKS